MDVEKAAKICTDCGAKCCKLGGSDFTEGEMQKVLEKGYKSHFRKVAKSHYELKSRNGICPYLGKDKLCTIYDARPPMCRAWPVYMLPSGNRKAYYLMECPLTDAIEKEDIKTYMKDAVKVKTRISNDSIRFSKLPEKDINTILRRFNSFKRKRLGALQKKS